MSAAGEVTLVATFTGAAGSTPNGKLVLASDGNLYGTTSSGLAESTGSVFKVTPAGELVTVAFSPNGPGAGELTYAGLVEVSPGTFLGTTAGGGTGNAGTVFRFTAAEPTATGAEGSALTQTGTFSDADGDETVTLTASSGTMTQDNDARTWSWTAVGADGPSSSTITITATDNADTPAEASVAFTFTVTNAAPVVTISAPASANEDAAVEFTFTATDPATADQDAGFSWTIDAGEGSPATTRPAGTLSPLVGDHIFTTPGTYTVTATATDKDGGVSLAAAHTITIVDVTRPVITSVSPNLVVEATSAGGANVDYAAATATDNSGGEPAITYSAASGSMFPVGTTTVLATAPDATGNAATASFAITVEPFAGDTDGDGMTDQYEIANGFDPNDPNDGAFDSDGDLLTNAQEFQAGTNPNNAADKPRISGFTPQPDGSVLLQIPTASGKGYRIEANDAFPTGEWSLVADNVAGTGGVVPVPDPGAAGRPNRIYRLTVLP